MDVQFEFYVLNHDFNGDKVYMYNIFNNCRVNERTNKLVRKYLKSPSKFCYETPWNDDTDITGFDAFAKYLDDIIMSQEWSRCEYEILVGSLWVVETKDILQELKGFVAAGKDIKEFYEFLEKTSKRTDKLYRWDCYEQAHANIKSIAHEVIRQYKEGNKKLEK